jgi:hypothetical protein
VSGGEEGGVFGTRALCGGGWEGGRKGGGGECIHVSQVLWGEG